jgi:hypothetical protein
MLKKFLNNRKGTAEVIGSVMFVIIIMFFFSSVYLWHDQATRQMNTVFSDKMNSPVSLGVVDGGLVVTNNGGVDVVLSRLWINDATGHIFASLENVEGHQILVAAGTKRTLALGNSTQYIGDGSSIKVEWGSPVTINYAPTGTAVFKILTTLGNTAACEWVLG